MTEREESIISRLDAVVDYIRVAEGKVARGEAVDLSGLDRAVGAICTDIESAEPRVARETEPHLSRLIKNLDALAGAVREQVEQLKT